MQKVVINMVDGTQLVSPTLPDEDDVLEYKEAILDLLGRWSPYIFEQLTPRGARTLVLSKETIVSIKVVDV